MRILATALAALLVVPSISAAQTAPADAVLDSAVVRAPGPGMWKVRRGENTLYILGVVSPLPRGMAWNAAPVRGVIAKADAVLAEPSVVVDADIGFFGKLALLPSLMGVRSNPDGKKLADVLPAASYARWTRLKQKHIGRDGSVERHRPLFAAMALYEEAVEDVGLTTRSPVRETVNDAIKARGLKPLKSSASIKIAKPKAALKDFKATSLADVECLDKTLDRVEFDLPALSARAQAWAAGDIEALRGLRHADLANVCQRAVMGAQLASKYGFDTLEAQARAKWLAEAEGSLARNRTTFAMLSMNEALGTNGLLAALTAKGYAVEAPGVQSPVPAGQ